jgi:hypothetical protein
MQRIHREDDRWVTRYNGFDNGSDPSGGIGGRKIPNLGADKFTIENKRKNMTTVVFKDGQFQTEDGIPFEDQNKIATAIIAAYPELNNTTVKEGSTYSIREKVKKIHQYRDRGVWVDATENVQWKMANNNHDYRDVARIVEEKERSGSFKDSIGKSINVIQTAKAMFGSEPSSVGEKPEGYETQSDAYTELLQARKRIEELTAENKRLKEDVDALHNGALANIKKHLKS